MGQDLLDAEAVEQELTEHTHVARVEEQRQSGVTDTPTFFVHGVRYDGSVSLQQLLSAIRRLHPDVHVASLRRRRGAFRVYAGRARRSGKR